MASLWLEGFDNTATAAQLTAKGWVNSGLSWVAGLTGVGSAVANTNTATLISKSFATSTTLICGFRQKVAVLGVDCVFLRVSTTRTLRLAINASTGHIEIRNSGGTLIATGSAVLAAGTAYYIEIKLIVNGASGSVAVQVNGASDIATTTGNFGSTGVDNFAFFANNATSPGQVMDDIFIFDGSGTTNKDFVGAVQVATEYPTGAGSHSAWTPNGAATNFGCVDEATPDDDTTYVSDSTPGDIDTYAFGDVDAGATVYAVQTNLYARKDDASVRQIAPVIRQAGTDNVGTTVTMTSAYAYYLQQYDKDPTGTAWSATTFNAEEIGVKEIA